MENLIYRNKRKVRKKKGGISMTNGKKLFAGLIMGAVLFTSATGCSMTEKHKAASIVRLDVNPSIELSIDRDGDVLTAEARNKDGEKVLKGMKLKGADADTAVNAIVGSLLRHGYIDNVSNTILLTVEDENKERGNELKEELAKEIDDILKKTEIQASVLSQNMKETSIDEKENISSGKAALIQNLVDENKDYKAEELADLSVTELNLVLTNSKNKVEGVASTGQPSDEAYIGREKAKEAAFAHALVKEENVRELDVEMDYEYKVMVYEVEFTAGEYEYDYTIDAKSGQVLHSHREYDNDNQESVTKKEASTTKKADKDIGRDKAKAIALSHAGITESAADRLKIERDLDDGRVKYSVEFTVNGKEYDFEIAGSDGKILDYDVETEDRNDK